MKKIRFALTAAAVVLMLSGCAASTEMTSENNTADETVVSENEMIYEADTVSEMTDISETSEETADTESSPSVAETQTEPYEIASETSAEPVSEAVQSRYYEIILNTDRTVYTLDDFADKQAVETAKELAMESELYKNTLAMAEEIRDIVTENGYEFSFEPVFIQGITDDFDGDGREESFFMLLPDLQVGEGGLIWVNSYVFFADADGNVTMLPECFYTYSSHYYPDRNGADQPIFTEIEYNGFSHVIISMGFNNNTTASMIYSVSDGVPKFETSQKIIEGTFENIGLLCGSIQIYYNWIAVWDNIDKCYVTPGTVELSDEEAASIAADPAVIKVFDEFENGFDYTEALVIGGKYYSFSDGDMVRTFIKTEAGYEASDIRIMPGNTVGCEPEEFNSSNNWGISLPLSEGLDLSEAVSEMVPSGD